MHVNPAKGTTCICLLTMLSTQHTIYPTCLHNTLNIQSVHSTPRHFPCLTSSRKPPKHKKSGSQNYCPNSPDSRKRLVFYTFSTLYFSTLDINTTRSTCMVILDDFRIFHPCVSPPGIYFQVGWKQKLPVFINGTFYDFIVSADGNCFIVSFRRAISDLFPVTTHINGFPSRGAVIFCELAFAISYHASLLSRRRLRLIMK